MEDSDTMHTGTGYLALKSGVSRQVMWEIEIADGSIAGGRIKGDEDHLALAARDGCATLQLTADMAAAIAIDRHDHTEMSFTTLMVSDPGVFYAQTIIGSSPILDDQFCIEFAGSDGESLRVIVPRIIMRDYIPIFDKVVPPLSASEKTAFIRVAKTWETARARTSGLVCVLINEDPPIGFSPDDARTLGATLIEEAKEIERGAALAS